MTVAQAKEKLRASATELESSALAPIEARRAILLALLAGILAGTAPESRKAIAKVLLRLLFE